MGTDKEISEWEIVKTQLNMVEVLLQAVLESRSIRYHVELSEYDVEPFYQYGKCEASPLWAGCFHLKIK